MHYEYQLYEEESDIFKQVMSEKKYSTMEQRAL